MNCKNDDLEIENESTYEAVIDLLAAKYPTAEYYNVVGGKVEIFNYDDQLLATISNDTLSKLWQDCE